MMSAFGWRHCAMVVGVLLCVGALSGCNTRLSKVVRADDAAPGGWAELRTPGREDVDVRRNGRPQDPRIPLALEPGDIVETGPGTAALIRFKDGGEAILAPRTKVRLGSLEVFFGDVLADLRGAFEIWDENLVAALGGTRFLFSAAPGHRTRVAVLEGWVRCRPRSGRWEPVRVQAGEQIHARPGASQQPRIEPLDRAEMERIERWVRTVRDPARPGYCCDGGRVREAYARDCRGHFEEDRRRAERDCQRGWCCRDGRVTSSIRAECRGSFHDRQSEAEKACAPREEPVVEEGWCCINGKLRQTDAKRCRASQGVFFTDPVTARLRCRPPATTTVPPIQ